LPGWLAWRSWWGFSRFFWHAWVRALPGLVGVGFLGGFSRFFRHASVRALPGLDGVAFLRGLIIRMGREVWLCWRRCKRRLSALRRGVQSRGFDGCSFGEG